MDFICRMLDALLAIAPVAAALFAGYAALQSAKAVKVAEKSLEVARSTAREQIEISKLEWLPYLSYEEMRGWVKDWRDGAVPNTMNAEFRMILKNNGRCVVQYEIQKFDVTLTVHYDEQVPVCEEGERKESAPVKQEVRFTPKNIREATSTKGVLGIHSVLAHTCGKYHFLLEDVNVDMDEAIFQFQIDFIVEFGKKGADKNEYSLEYVVDMEYKNKKFVESISKADIEGY